LISSPTGWRCRVASVHAANGGDAVGLGPSSVKKRFFYLRDFTRSVETARQCRRGRSLDLDGNLRFAAAYKQQIDLGVVFRSIKVRNTTISSGRDQIFNDETFPARPSDCD
jgi:hypothetical protein